MTTSAGAEPRPPVQAPVVRHVGGRPPGRLPANPRTRKSADRNGLTLCESQIPVEKGRNFDFLQRQSPGVSGTLARISPWVKLSAGSLLADPLQEGSLLLRYPARNARALNVRSRRTKSGLMRGKVVTGNPLNCA